MIQILRNMARRRVRTGLTVFGIAIGVFALTVMGAMSENFAQLLIAHLGERRVHHQDKADGDRNVGCPRLKVINESFNAHVQVAYEYTCGHR